MKDKLEVGIYVRTKKGIAKIIDRILEPNHYYFKMWVTDKFLEINDDTEYISEVDVLKASHNIIDLIEVGDYINGLRIEKNKYGELYISYVYYGGDIGKQYEIYTTWLKELKEDMIYNIVTHEQMEQMAYKVGE